MTLDVEAARAELLRSLPPRDPKWRIWVDGVLERLADRCEVEDPRIERVRALCDAAEKQAALYEPDEAGADPLIDSRDIRAALR